MCVSFDKVAILITTLSFTTPPSLIQVISGAGKPTVEQERLTFFPAEITLGTGCSKKKALTARGGRKGRTIITHDTQWGDGGILPSL